MGQVETGGARWNAKFWIWIHWKFEDVSFLKVCTISMLNVSVVTFLIVTIFDSCLGVSYVCWIYYQHFIITHRRKANNPIYWCSTLNVIQIWNMCPWLANLLKSLKIILICLILLFKQIYLISLSFSSRQLFEQCHR